MATTTATKKAESAEDMVTVKLPLTRERQEDVFVGVNGKNMLIKRGEEVKIPRAFAEVLQNAEEMETLALERRMKKPNKK